MTPEKLKQGGHIRVIAPARSHQFLAEGISNIAKENLQEMGFAVSFGRNIDEIDEFNSSSISSRLEDIHEAFQDNTVDAILTVIGGYNSNQLLKYIDYQLIKRNPKIICGYSDITAICNAIHFKTGLVTYIGPHFSTWGMKKERIYTEQYFTKCCLDNSRFELFPSSTWSDDLWFLEQNKMDSLPNEGYWIINSGSAKGESIGGNLSTLSLLCGTDFFHFKDCILFIEDTGSIKPETFDHLLQSIIHQSDFEKVKGILIGRFQKNSNISKRTLSLIIKSKIELSSIPVIANVDFGHTNPIITIPVGGIIDISTKDNLTKVNILQH